MTKAIIAAVAVGIISGYTWVPAAFIDMTGNLIMVVLCILLVFVGMDLGKDGTVVQNVRSAGFRVLLFPVGIVLGTALGCFVGSLFLPISFIDAQMVGAGYGWYTLAPVIISEYSTEISAVSFMYNVFRELLGIIIIPLIAKYVGAIECISLPGSAAMDVCLPIVDHATDGKAVVYSFVSGVVLSICVPVFVTFIVGIAAAH